VGVVGIETHGSGIIYPWLVGGGLALWVVGFAKQ
jgi:hypothetical protein